MVKTAILVDGGFFLKRYNKLVANGSKHDGVEKADFLYEKIMNHLNNKGDLYRVLYYDCKPFEGKAHNPITGKPINFAITPQNKARKEFFECLKKKRKVALRLGELATTGDWLISAHLTKDLIKGKIAVSDLTERQVSFDIRQKKVDIKIGLDIASLAYKGNIEKIILISGDSDFVPAAKLARREGIDFILDPMWQNVEESLHEHIDGLHSVFPKPRGFKSKY